MALEDDEDIIRFGERAHAAFPEIPLLGVDIVRELPSGRLFALEVHPEDSSWHFTSPHGLRAQREFGFTFGSQFDAFQKAAGILAGKARQDARRPPGGRANAAGGPARERVSENGARVE